MNWVDKLFPETRFGGFSPVDGTIAFYLRVNSLLKPSDIVLDVGCGRGAYKEDPVRIRKELRILRGKVKRVIGLDPDPQAASNPFLDEFILLENPNDKWPVTEGAVDLVISDWTLEHVEKPALFFSEICRVLRPGGFFCARTTNSWGYVAVFSRIIPEPYHVRLLRRLQPKREVQDIFPTRYRCNSIPLLKKYLSNYGFDGVVIGYPGLPAYLHFSFLLTVLGYFYESHIPPFLRHTLMIFAQKK